MRFIVSFIAAALFSVGLAVPAEAHDTRPCVTRKEYRRIDNGDSIRRVTRVFDTKGYLVSRQGPWVSRNYKPCGDGLVNVVFKNKNVKGKYATWENS